MLSLSPPPPLLFSLPYYSHSPLLSPTILSSPLPLLFSLYVLSLHLYSSLHLPFSPSLTLPIHPAPLLILLLTSTDGSPLSLQ